MNVYNFVEVADDAFLGCFSEGFEIDVILFALIVGFVFIEMKCVVVATGAEAFGVDVDFSFAPFACCNFGLPFEFFIARITEAFGVVFFFLITVGAFFYHVE